MDCMGPVPLDEAREGRIELSEARENLYEWMVGERIAQLTDSVDVGPAIVHATL
jgi:hypothetical protein